MTADTVRIRVRTYRKDLGTDAVHFDRDDLRDAGLANDDEVVLDVRGALIRGHVREANGQHWLGTQLQGKEWNYRQITDDLRAVGVTKPNEAIAVIVEHNGVVPPTSDPVVLEKRASTLQPSKSHTAGIGSQQPTRVNRMVSDFVRSPQVIADVREAASGHCELCAQLAPFVRDDGTPFLEVHHVVTLADGGRDTVDNAVALCPNCHRLLHYAAEADRRSAADRLRVTVTRLRSK